MATYKHLRSSTANKRPTTSITDGQLAINTNTASPGLFFKDSAGTGIVKVGPVHVGTTAPNATPAAGGSSGNYLGEQWLDTSVSPAQMKVWNGSAWVGIVADELPVSKLQDGDARQLLQTDAAGTGVEWTSNVDVPGTLDVTGATTLDSTLTVPLGSAAAPTLTFTGDTNTGIYSPGADQVAVATNGTGRLFVNANGAVSVVSASTGSTNFTVNGAASLSTSANWNYPGLLLRRTASNVSSAKQISFLLDGDTEDDTTLTNYLNIWGTYSGTPTTSSTSTGLSASMNLGAPNAFIAHTNGSERLRITSAGLVGIGTSSPGAKLQVSETSGTGPIFLADFTAVAASQNPLLRIIHRNAANTTTSSVDLYKVYQSGFGIINNDTDASNFTSFTVGASERARIDSSGRLLVGTSSARANFYNGTDTGIFQVEGANDVAKRFSSFIYGRDNADGPLLLLGKHRGTSVGSSTLVASGDEIGRITFQGTDGTEFVAGAEIQAFVDGTPGANDMPGRLVLSTTANGASSPTERMRITSAGTLAVGTTAKQDSNPVSLAVGAVSPGTPIETQINTTSGSYAVMFRNPNGLVGNILTSGSSTAFNTSSDYRLKENVTPVSDGISRLQQLKPSRFNFIADPDTVVDGFIAHEVQTIVPEAITGEKDAVDDEGNPEYQGIDQSKLVPLLTAALQEAIGEIESLKARVAALEAN